MLDCDVNAIGPNPWHNTVNYFCVPDQFGLDIVFVHKICAKFSCHIFVNRCIYCRNIFYRKYGDSYTWQLC